MNTKKWLTLGLSVALAATAALAACAPTEPNTPDEGDNPSTPHVHTYTKWDYSDTEHWRVCPDDGEIDVSTRAKHSFDRVTHVCISCGYEEPHTHSYTAWRYDILQHWKVCPDDKAIDESTRGSHNYVEGVCEDCGRKEPEMYVYGVGREAFGNVGHWPTVSDIRGKKDQWVKMELGDDGKYTADVYLTPDALFAVGDAVSLVRYPAAGDPDATTGALQVETANTYTVTFDPADGSVTFAVHAHTYVWKYDADSHWKVCSTKDQAVDESSRGTHSYDSDTHACVCGAVETVSCDHSKGYSFNYTELPECNAEGGTLQKTCPDCSDTQDVHYDKGFGTGLSNTVSPSSLTVLTNAGTYYLRGANGFKFETTTAGTYTFRFAGKLIPAMQDVKLDGFYIGDTYPMAMIPPLVAIAAGKDGTLYAAQIAAYGVQIDGYESGQNKQFNSLTFTVKDTDVADGKKVCVQVIFYISNNLSGSAQTDGYLITVECPAPAAAASAPAEVALIPDRKN